MDRRKFLGTTTLGLAALALAPVNLSALDYRKSKPKAWTATKVDDAIKEVFGSAKTVSGAIDLKAPDIAENGAVIPISVESSLNAKTVAIFQDANPESTVAVFTIPKDGVIDYAIRIKMRKTGTVTVVADVDGKLVSTSKVVKVTIGGCGG